MNHSRNILLVIGSLSFGTGLFVFFKPYNFYELIPGLSLMGPFSVHFIKDVGLAYVAGGAILLAAARLNDHRLAFAGTLWFFLHALFHLQIWTHRGMPLDLIFWFDLAAVVLPAFASLWAGFQLKKMSQR